MTTTLLKYLHIGIALNLKVHFFITKVIYFLVPSLDCLGHSYIGKAMENFPITPYIHYACKIINYVCALLFLKTIAIP